jgi:hypothetical protein
MYTHEGLGFPPDAFQNGDYAFFDAENNAGLIVGDYAAIMLVALDSRGLCRNYARVVGMKRYSKCKLVFSKCKFVF